MPRRSTVNPEQIELIRNGLSKGLTRKQIALAAGVSVSASNRIVNRVRTAAEFKGGAAVVAPQRQQPLAGGWNLDEIRDARDQQMRGQFQRAVRLAEAMRTDDVLFTAYHNRIAPQSAVATRLLAASGVRGEAVQRKAAVSCSVSRGTLAGVVGTLANHGIAIGYVLREVSDEGDRVDFKLSEWPLEHVRYNHSAEQLETSTRGGLTVPIVHGDGYWIVFRKFEVLPWTQDAAILPGSLLWAAHAYGISDWAAASKSHGQAKIMGTLPQGVSLQTSDGEGGTKLTDEAAGYLRMLQDIVSGEAGAGLSPFGAEADFLANGSSAWQVFSELAMNREKGAARVYTGTDAALGSQGGAPGVDIATLFGVATTRIQGDFDAIEQGLNTGFYQPWTAINYGESHLAPRFDYQLPDPDAAAKSKEHGERYDRLWAAVEGARKTGINVNQNFVDTLCARFGIEDPVKLKPVPVTVGGPPNPKA